MNPWERNQVGLEFVQVDVERSIKSQGGGNGRNDLSDQSVEVGKGWGSDSQVSTTDVIDTANRQQQFPGMLTHASLSTMNEQSECSSVVWVVRTELYGSTTEVDIFGAGYTENSSFDFLP